MVYLNIKTETLLYRSTVDGTDQHKVTIAVLHRDLI